MIPSYAWFGYEGGSRGTRMWDGEKIVYLWKDLGDGTVEAQHSFRSELRQEPYTNRWSTVPVCDCSIVPGAALVNPRHA